MEATRISKKATPPRPHQCDAHKCNTRLRRRRPCLAPASSPHSARPAGIETLTIDGSPRAASGQGKPIAMSTGLLARVALMLGNFVIGVGILAPAGMLDQLAHGLAGPVAAPRLLVPHGAVVLCFGPPLMARATPPLDRRTPLASSL